MKTSLTHSLSFFITLSNLGKDEWPEAYSQCSYSAGAVDLERGSNDFSDLSDETPAEVKIMAQPNPTSSSVLITATNAKSDIERIDVFDTFGRIVMLLKSRDSWNIQMGGLTNGVYFIQVHFEDGSISQTRILKSE